MENQNMFWSLVRHNLKGNRRNRPWHIKPWRTVYIVFVLLILVVVSTYAGLYLKDPIDLSVVWFFTFGLPFMAFGKATSLIVYEWRNGTVGWWLSLPMSRISLITAKYVAALLRTMQFFILSFFLIAFLGLYTMFLKGSFSAQASTAFLMTGLKWYGLLICLCPITGAFGVLLGVLRESRIRPALPLIWGAIGTIWWLVSIHGAGFLHFKVVNGHMAVFHPTLMLLYPFAASLMIAYVMIYLSAYLLCRQLAL